MQALRHRGFNEAAAITPRKTTGNGRDNGAGDASPNGAVLPELALMRRRVAALRGDVELDAAPGWGTALVCRLPLHDLAPAPESPANM